MQPQFLPKRLISVPSNQLVQGAYDVATSDTTGNPHKLKEIVITFRGSYRVRYSVAAVTQGSTAGARVYKNSNPLGGTNSTPLTSYIDVTEDLGPFDPGDLIQLYAWCTIGGGFAARVKAFTISGEYAVRPLGIEPGAVNLD